jgi:isoaspartyl peptidase/L-asparaginase-like protein (Ntn-hydrolase superfamily)
MKKLGGLCERNMEKNNQGNGKKDKIDEIFSDEKQITEAMQRAVREAVEIHKRAGNPIAVWKDGKAIWVETK